MEGGYLKLIASKGKHASPEEDQIVWKYQEEAKHLGLDKVLPEVYSNQGME
jgi:hypothetical protein